MEHKIEEDKVKLSNKERELRRTEKEKYYTPAIKMRWKIIPSLISGAVLYVAILYISNNSSYPMNGFNIVMAVAAVLGSVTMWALSLQDNWEKIKEIKSEICVQNPNYNFYECYDSNLVYTDSKFDYLFFRVGKMMAYSLSVIGCLGMAGFVCVYAISNASSVSTLVRYAFIVWLIYLAASYLSNLGSYLKSIKSTVQEIRDDVTIMSDKIEQIEKNTRNNRDG